MTDPALPSVVVSFISTTTDNESQPAVGVTTAPLHRVDVEDDGTTHAYVDHWPIPVPTQADFDAVRDKRMSELTPEQQRLATELWLRRQYGWSSAHHRENYEFLFAQIDAARGYQLRVEDPPSTT